ncbi:uncharacterized protein LOC142584738 isoform X1 [Dermacentor variabilis]|uniref:uncharacterized protein LOC142584738 isoform X1 n=1 Tax=Dermacentor variabilis TaxID=34621 RepID=UPI003F5C5AED
MPETLEKAARSLHSRGKGVGVGDAQGLRFKANVGIRAVNGILQELWPPEKVLAALLSGPLALHGCDSAATSADHTYEPMHHGNQWWPCDCASTITDVDVFKELAAKTLTCAKCPVIKVPYVP